jgi:hypothetical protein
MNNISISDAISFLIPNSEFRIVEDDLTTLEFFSPKDQKHPTQSEIDAALEQIKADRLIETEAKTTEKAALLEKLGITADEAALLLS